MASTPEIKRKYRTYVLRKIASHFGVSARKVLANNSLDADILEVDGTPFFNVLESIYVTHVSELKLEQVLYHDKFIKSRIYDEFVNGEQLANSFNYVMALHLNGLIFIIYRSTEYDGSGGIQLNNGKQGEGFAVVPIKNYLNDKYPRPDPE